jgi:hypothetical protein
MLDVAAVVEDIGVCGPKVGSGDASMLDRMVGGCGFAAGVTYC